MDSNDLDGAWTLEYEGDAYLFGGGVVVVQGTRILGGDSWYYYSGSVSLEGTHVSATVDARAFISSATTVFGNAAREFTVKLFGEISNGVIRGRIIPTFAPATAIGVVLIKRT